jgi:toxin ParE1/3/4
VSFRPEIDPEAAAEIEETAAWYETRRTGLGLEFVAAIDHALDVLAERPEQGPLWRPDRPWRRYLVTRFPFVIFYRVDDSRVLVRAATGWKSEPSSTSARMKALRAAAF